MIKRTYEELEPYFPPGHFGVTCKRYHGKDETGASKFWIGVLSLSRTAAQTGHMGTTHWKRFITSSKAK